MAIKISNNTVIDDSRKFIPITIEAGGTVGSAGSVLASTGSGLEWVTAATGSGESYWVQTDVGIHTLSNVGIGTTNPGEALQVNGNLRVGYSQNYAGNNYIAFGGIDGEPEYTGAYIGEIANTDNSGTELLIFKGDDEENPTGPDRVRIASGEFRFETISAPGLSGDFVSVAQTTNLVNRFIIKNDGKTGIGTTNPSATLDVFGTTETQQLIVTGVSTFQSEVYDSLNSAGTSGQVLTSTGAGVTWATLPGSSIDILDDIGGSFNGSTTTFNLTESAVAYTPANAQSLRVVLGGVVQEPITDYTVSGSQITFTTAPDAGLSISIVAFDLSGGGGGVSSGLNPIVAAIIFG